MNKCSRKIVESNESHEWRICECVGCYCMGTSGAADFPRRNGQCFDVICFVIADDI